MKKTILSIAICWGALGAYAQDLSTEITVERTVEVSEQPASPSALVVPSVLASPGEARPLNPAEYTLTTLVATATDSLAPSNLSGLPGRWPWRGYASVGYFPMLNLGAWAGYRLVASPTATLDAGVHYFGEKHHGGRVAAQGAGGLTDEEKLNASCQTVGLDVAGAFDGRGWSGNFAVDYDHYAVERPDGHFTDKYNADAGGLKVSAGGGASIWWKGNAELGYMNISDLCGTLRLALGARGGYKFNSNAGADLGAAYTMRNFSDHRVPDYFHTSERGGGKEGTPYVATFTPGFTYLSPRLRLRLGLRVDLAGNTGESHFGIAPDAEASYTCGSFGIFGAAGGDYSLYGLEKNIAVSPYLIGSLPLPVGRTPISAGAGVRYGARGFKAQVAVGYAVMHNAPVMDAWRQLTGADMRGWKIGADLGYESSFHGLGGLVSAVWTPERNGHQYATSADLPLWSVRAAVNGKPLDALSLQLAFEHRHGRKCRNLFVWESLENVSDLSLEAVYLVNKGLSVGLRVDNLLCRRWLLVPGVESARLGGLAYVQIRF